VVCCGSSQNEGRPPPPFASSISRRGIRLTGSKKRRPNGSRVVTAPDANLQHHGSQQRILNLLNHEDTPYNASCAFAIERSRGACSRRAYPLHSHSIQSCATMVESVHPDSRHHALSDPCPRSIGVISPCNGLSDACLHHSVAGSGHLLRSRPSDLQVRVGSPLR
jgi:hypothetical protein